MQKSAKPEIVEIHRFSKRARQKIDQSYACLAVAQISANRIARRRESSQLALRPRKDGKVDKSKKLKVPRIKCNFATNSSRMNLASPSLQKGEVRRPRSRESSQLALRFWKKGKNDKSQNLRTSTNP